MQSIQHFALAGFCSAVDGIDVAFRFSLAEDRQSRSQWERHLSIPITNSSNHRSDTDISSRL